MGFRIQRKVFRLHFKDSDLEGLEVLARSLNTGQFLDMEEAKAERAAGGKRGKVGTERMLELFAGELVSWNAEDEDGIPVPATMEGIRSQDLDLSLKIIDAWTDAIAGVSVPLPETSSAGQPSALEASIPMASPSESLAS
jgi:hypothetical protein